jgi:hypothetical protein
MRRALANVLKVAAGTMTLAALLGFTGCVQSVYPWYEERDVVFEGDLGGTWVGEGDVDSCVLRITADPARESRHYDLEASKVEGGCPDIENGVNLGGGGQLVRIGRQRFLDVWDDNYHLHTILKINIDPKALSLVAIDSDALGSLIKRKGVKLRGRVEGHLRDPDDVLLTSSTLDLRRFLIAHAGDPKLFGPELRFHRK